jgi:dipeptidase
MPGDIGSVLWVGLSRPSGAIYLPFYFGIHSIPERFACGDDDCAPAFTVYKNLSDELLSDYAARIDTVRSAVNAIESPCRQLQGMVEGTALELHRLDPELARDFLTSYVTGLSERALRKARRLTSDLENVDSNR